ncbi:hypothetical protein N7541_005143 [Penicillium brevicompactum]|uniref:Uncharacterized protein n=1 Tax=Penicillium brevicompactum TaxID=5074 RepID=A0A9W9UWN5_PENBR|nr:hypothetical protein N7541_005143 [Penicillium brevicompactum]
MKSPLWLLTVLLPLATELAAASPAANPDPDSLESLESFDDANEFEERDLEDRQGGSRQGNKCRINRPYWYYKYPCDSSDRTGQARVGSQFSATCRYKVGFVTPTNLEAAREIGSADALEAAFDDLWYL